MKYNVRTYAVVGFTIKGVEAESQEDAIAKAEKSADLHKILDGAPDDPYEKEWAEDRSLYEFHVWDEADDVGDWYSLNPDTQQLEKED